MCVCVCVCFYMAFVHRASLIAAFGILFEPINKTISQEQKTWTEERRVKKNYKRAVKKKWYWNEMK